MGGWDGEDLQLTPGDVVWAMASNGLGRRDSVAYAFLMRVRVLYFAGLKEALGLVSEELDLPAGMNVLGLLQTLRGRANGVVATGFWDSIAVAVNQEYMQAGVELMDGDEVALLPPVSGGCGEDEWGEGRAG